MKPSPGRSRPLGADVRPVVWRQRLVSWRVNFGPTGAFALRFAILMGIYYGVMLMPWCERLLFLYLKLHAWLANGLLNWLGQESQVTEITLRSAQFAITVRRGCDAIEPSWFLGAAMVAFPGPWKRKLLGVLAGSLLLQGMNLVRIVSLYFIGLYFPAFFQLAHVEIWPVLFILVSIILWVAWVSWVRRPAAPAAHAL